MNIWIFWTMAGIGMLQLTAIAIHVRLLAHRAEQTNFLLRQIDQRLHSRESH